MQDWFLAVYVDAVEWVELPNVASMALYADGGRLASKPYISGGAYVNRMSNYCKNCRYRFDERTGDKACPLTTLYWHFIDQNKAWLQRNPRTSLMVKNSERIPPAERLAITQRAHWLFNNIQSL